MKVRWREHEMITVAILITWQITRLLMDVSAHSIEDLQGKYVFQFKDQGLPFNYWTNVLLPKVSSLLLILAVYLLINLMVLPLFIQIRTEDIERLFTRPIVKAIFSVVFVSFVLAIGINVISFYGKPHLFHYGGYRWLAIAGYNDKPLDDLFFGFGRALGAVAVVTAIAGTRDLFIWTIEKNTFNREYRVSIVNNATSLLAIYICGLVIIDPGPHDVSKYLIFGFPLIPLYIYLTFSLFPFKGKRTFGHHSVYSRLLLSTFICIVPSLLLYSGHSRPASSALLIPIIYWMFLLLIITPLVWIIYLQRKARILQLRSMETALFQSKADLQFLKSQINPHFLFNALNTLYGTALKEESDKTASGIQKLGDMMRFMLHENTLDFIPMEKEIEYLRNYIALQKLRVQSSPAMRIEENIDAAPFDHKIAPMLLIPFVENAFKHGISLEYTSWILISLGYNENLLNFEVRNSIHRHVMDPENGKSGIGLSNVKERLRLQYPNKHVLHVSKDDNEFYVKLVLQC